MLKIKNKCKFKGQYLDYEEVRAEHNKPKSLVKRRNNVQTICKRNK